MLEHAKSLSRRIPAPLMVCGLVAVVTALNVRWRTIETRPPHWDMGHHLANSLIYLNGFSFSHLLRFFQAYLFYPPLVYWVADVFYAVLGNESMWVAILSNAVWLAILALATYGIGRRLWTPRVGWLSVVFVLGAPVIVSTSKEFMLDLPLTAISALALYLLIRADGFSSRRYSLLFGVCCGFAMLVKWTFPLVIALPAIHAAATALSQIRLRRVFTPVLNLLGAAALTVAVCGVWYAHNWREVGSSSLYFSSHAVDQTNPHGAAAALFYVWNLLNVQLYAVPLLLVSAGIVYSFRRHELARRNVYPILLAGGTFVLFTLLHHKDPRYSLPMLPALAIIGTSWLEYVAARARRWIEIGFVAYSAIAFVAISFGTSLLPASIAFDVPAGGIGLERVALFQQSGLVIGPPTHENWHQVDPFRVMSRAPVAERSLGYRGPDTIWFNKHGLNYYALRYGVHWARTGPAHFVLVRGHAARVPPGLSPIERWPLPDGGTLVLYRRG